MSFNLYRGDLAERPTFLARAVSVFAFIVSLDGYSHLVRYFGGVKPVNIAGLLLGALALPSIGRVFADRHPGLSFWFASLTVTTFVTLIISIMTGHMPASALLTFWQMLALAFIACHVCSTPAGVRIVLQMFLVGFTASLGAFIFFYRQGGNLIEIYGRVMSVRGYICHRAGLHAAWVLIIVIVTYGLWRRMFRNFLLAVTAPICGYVILLTNTKTVHVVLAVALAGYVLLVGKVSGRIKGAALLGLVALLVLFLFGRQEVGSLMDFQVERWSATENMTFLTTHRNEIFSAAWRLGWEKPLGWGVGNALPEIAKSVTDIDTKALDPHNDFLNIWLDGGLLALILFVWGQAKLFRDVYRLPTVETGRWTTALLVSIYVAMMGATNLMDKVTCILLGVIMGLVNQAHHAEAEVHADEVTPTPIPAPAGWLAPGEVSHGD